MMCDYDIRAKDLKSRKMTFNLMQHLPSDDVRRQMFDRIARLEKFILSRCCCKSIPGPQTCSYCEAVNGEAKDG